MDNLFADDLVLVGKMVEEVEEELEKWRAVIEIKGLRISPSGVIYTTIGGLSSKCEEFLAGQSQFDCDHGVEFSAPTCCQSATFVRPLFALYCPLFFTEGNNQ